MKDFEFWAQESKCYEQLKVVDDMKDSGSCAQGSRFYEQAQGYG